MTVICSQSMFKYRDYFFRNLIILFSVQKTLICWFAYTSRLMSDEGSWSKNGCLHYMSLCMRTISHRWHNFSFPIWCTINHLDYLKIVQFISHGPDLTINIMVPQVISKLGRCIFLKNSLGLGCSWDLAFFFFKTKRQTPFVADKNPLSGEETQFVTADRVILHLSPLLLLIPVSHHWSRDSSSQSSPFTIDSNEDNHGGLFY